MGYNCKIETAFKNVATDMSYTISKQNVCNSPRFGDNKNVKIQCQMMYHYNRDKEVCTDDSDTN